MSDRSRPNRPMLSHPLMMTWFAFLASFFVEATNAAGNDADTQRDFFENRVRPLLSEHCFECHGPNTDDREGGLRLDHGDFVLRGGDTGPALVAGNADESLLIGAVRYDTDEMPPSGKLPDTDIAILERWVNEGAYWPKEPLPGDAGDDSNAFDLDGRRQSHWAWHPIRPTSPPDVIDAAWPRDAIDRFILAGLEQVDLSPSAPTDRMTLMRRLTFALTGLPPTPDEIEAFANSQRPDAITRLVDRLIASPEFGQRWGRHWLDLVRYAESRGHEFDADIPGADHYRDYVVRGLNADVPYDQWVREHIAGDLLAEPRMSEQGHFGDQPFNESVLGTGFWHLGEWVHSPVDIRKEESDRIDNMIDVMSKTFLGVTVACARCHDHKFDAISTADYYSLSGFLQSSDFREVRFDSVEHNRKIAERLSELDREHRQRVWEMFDLDRSKASVADRSKDPSREGALARSTDEIMPSGTVHRLDQIADVDYRQDGFAFGAEPIRAGTPVVPGPDSDAIVLAKRTAAATDSFWNGLQSIRSRGTNVRGKLQGLPSSGRTLRLPTFELTNPIVSCRVQGSGTIFACVDSHRLVNGPLHGETIASFKNVDGWVELNLTRYMSHRLHLEFIPAKDASLDVVWVIQSDSENKQDCRDEVDQHLSRSAEEVEQLENSLNEQLAADATAQDQWQRLRDTWLKERAELRAKVQSRSRLAIAMMDGSGEDAAVLIRGNSSSEGDLEPRHFLTAVSGGKPIGDASGSGRLQLADAINSPDNPLTSRVITNRLWHHLMGRGIVPTTDDFGELGRRPTHPELLDHLATDFDRHGRHLKWTLRRIATSTTYAMSMHPVSASEAELGDELDPKNERLHRRQLQRLEGEVIRDSLLAISGQLDRSFEGGSVPVHLTGFMEGRGRPKTSGPLDGDRRRSIYIAVRRNFLSPMMSVFDTPSPFSTMGRRNVSNVPAQALVMLNDPFVLLQARHFGERAIREVPQSNVNDNVVIRRIDWMVRTALGRPARPDESESIQQHLRHRAKIDGVSLNEPTLWAEVGHALFNTKEFVFLP